MSGVLRTKAPPDPYRPRTPEELHQAIGRARAEQARTVLLIGRLLARRIRRSAAGVAIRRVARDAVAACRWLPRLVVERLCQRQAIAALNGMSDSALKDVGVSRSEIRWIAQHGRTDRRPATPPDPALTPERKRAA